MKVAVIGGGLFGSTAAVYAARAGHEVHLFEAKSELMAGATANTFARLHRGAHYPRHAETGRESRMAEPSFRAEYGACVIDGGIQRYIVPSERSHVTRGQFAAFLDDEGLPFWEEGGIFTVHEPRICLAGLQALVRQKVRDAGVTVYLGHSIAGVAAQKMRDRYDHIVVATYANLNAVLSEFGCAPQEYKFQVVEKPIAMLPAKFRDTSIVVIDGPFGCIDPLDDTPLHVIGHVTKTIHAENTGLEAVVPPDMARMINAGIIQEPADSRFWEAVWDLAQWMPGIERARYIGSTFTVRAVLAHQESTDARPTLTRQHDRQISSVFSGKLGTAPRAAMEIVAILADQHANVLAA